MPSVVTSCKNVTSPTVVCPMTSLSVSLHPFDNHPSMFEPSPSPTSGLSLEEYRALRATIRERGSLRVWIVVLGVVMWAALVLGETATDLPGWTALVSLLVLWVVFEVVFALHIGVERIGRYLQVFFEEERAQAPAPSPSGEGWETHIMEFGRRFPGGGSDPLFCRVFWAATALNLLPLTSRMNLATIVLVGACHAALARRLSIAREMAGTQRTVDLERFRQLRDTFGSAGARPEPTAGPHNPSGS